jgi:hypothetical protein
MAHPPVKSKTLALRTPLVVLLLSLLCSIRSGAEGHNASDYDRWAHTYLEGPTAAPNPTSEAQPSLQRGTSGLPAWQAYEKSIGVPLRKWAAAELAPPKGGTVFYPFSGPDLVTVAQMFPEADRYVLVAIQPAGPVVNPFALEEKTRSNFLSKFHVEWVKFGALGFFRTLDLNENTASTTARLTSTPVLMAFAAALGFEIQKVCPLEMNAEKGEYEPTDSPKDPLWTSVRLNLTREGRAITADYICMDLSDDFLHSHRPEQAWIRKMGQQPVLLKAASHLLPKPYFSVCREAIVSGAPLLVQDETGLEYPDLQRMGTVKLYGRFSGVLHLFNQESQGILAEAYSKAGQTSPLPFAFSYQKSADKRSLQVVRRKPDTVLPVPPQ